MTTAPASDDPTYRNLTTERVGSHVVITIDRPRSLNALSRETLGELRQAIDWVATDDSIRAVVITGAGDRAFVAGADIAELQEIGSAAEAYEYSRSTHNLLESMETLAQPVIMAVNGYALGGGCELALAGDIIIAADSARFGQPEVNLGLIPGFGGTVRLPRLIGRTRALEMILLGEPVKAQQALEWGLVNRVVPQADLSSVAGEIAEALASKPPVAVALAKRAVYQGLSTPASEANQMEASMFGLAMGTEDRREGTAAFLEKRQAVWRGE